MISKRIIPCLDVRDGKLTKGIKFQGNIDIGDPVEAAREYYEQGADEIVFYDITASSDGRDIMIDVVSRVAKTIFIPFSVGGGIRNVEDMRRVIMAGAEKVSVNSTAVTSPDIIAQGAQAFGSQCIVLGMDVKKVEISAKKLTLATGETQTLEAGVKPKDATIKDVIWQSSDPAVAAVDASGRVTAVSKGTAEIIALSKDGYYKITCIVTVTGA